MMGLRYRHWHAVVAGALLSLAQQGLAADGETLVNNQCSECHQVTRPGDGHFTLDERMERKGPPLYYAGNKYREGWMAEWLQKPERIWLAGVFPPAHTTTNNKGEDVVDESSLIEHPTLDKADAQKVADHLMALTPHTDRLEGLDYKPKPIPKRMGAMNFIKFKGCGACHQDERTYGGTSGPQLYTAAKRLKPAFMASYIMDPTLWEPRSLMPDRNLDKKAAQKLINYLHVVGEDAP